jgi:GTPase SAR1 family protein
VALSPAADRLALSIGQRLSIAAIRGNAVGAPLAQLTCALAPGLAWSPDGRRLAFRDDRGRGRLLDLSDLSGPGPDPRPESIGLASAVAFAPDGNRLVRLAHSLPGKMILSLLDSDPDHSVVWECTLTTNRFSANRFEGINLTWSPDGRWLACTTGTSKIWLIDASSGQVTGHVEHHDKTVTGLRWMDEEWIVSASADATMQVWRLGDPMPTTVIETIPAAGMIYVRELNTALVWSSSGQLLGWSLAGGLTQLWYRDPPLRNVAAHFTRPAVSATAGLLVLVDPGATELLFVSNWNRSGAAPADSTTYANAKVLLLGETGVGKSGLAMVLAGEQFRATDSTHGRKIWRLVASENAGTSGEQASDDEREVLLWDLAGQPGYRIVHQLHLGGAAVAVIVFDSRSESQPLADVRHWARAVRHAHPLSTDDLAMFLVAARTDRDGISISNGRIDQVKADFGIDAYLATSAKEGDNVDRLRSMILAAIDWEQLPKITSTALFAEVRRFVVEQKDDPVGSLLIPLDELSRRFQNTVPDARRLLSTEQALDLAETQEQPAAGLTALFEGCIARLESAGLVKRLKYGDYILLRPELLDAYASAIVNAAKNEPDGHGSIMESKVIELDFPIPSENRVEGHLEERLLVIATLEELIRYEIVLREQEKDGTQLVFPSAYRRDLPASEAPRGDCVVFRFEGPIESIYATLVVRLALSDRFTRTATWQSAARFAADNGECTVFLKPDGEGKAELSVGYDNVPPQSRMQFERFVHTHLERRATDGKVVRQRQYCCPHDKSAFTPEQVEQRRRLGKDDILCPVCERRTSLRDDYEPTADTELIAEMDASADRRREDAAASTVLKGKEEVEEFDVFLCHNVGDKPAVRLLADQLCQRGLRPWLDERELQPGLPWQRRLEEQIERIPAAAVIVGSKVGPWQNQELEAFLRQFIRRHCPVIPVRLPGAEIPKLPIFLDGMTWVDLGATDPDPLDQLEWGITGKQPQR